MTESVLFVDDDASVRLVVELALGDIGGMRVTAVGSGAEALEAAARVRPDIVLLDVVLPDMDGPDVLDGLRALPATTETPIIFCTARSRDDDIAALRALGAAGVIPKPLDPLTLAATVRRLVAALDGR